MEPASQELDTIKQSLTWRLADRSASMLRVALPRETLRGRTARRLRESQNLTLADVAGRANISSAMLSL